jgi:hypothetical protein
VGSGIDEDELEENNIKNLGTQIAIEPTSLYWDYRTAVASRFDRLMIERVLSSRNIRLKHRNEHVTGWRVL